MALVTEGGYDLEALGDCLEASLTALAAPPEGFGLEFAQPAARGERALAAVRAAQAPYWRGI
jgi:hypothetical protein